MFEVKLCPDPGNSPFLLEDYQTLGRYASIFTDETGKVLHVGKVNYFPEPAFRIVESYKGGEKFHVLIDICERDRLQVVKQIQTIEKIEKDALLCPIEHVNYCSTPVSLSIFQSEIFKSNDGAIFRDFSKLENRLTRKDANLTMDIFMTCSFVYPGMRNWIFAIRQDPEYKVTTSLMEGKKLWMIYVEDDKGKFNLKKNILLDHKDIENIDDVLIDALSQAAGVEKEENNSVRYYPVENADSMKQLEMVSGNVLEKGMGYFVLFSKQYITNKQ